MRARLRLRQRDDFKCKRRAKQELASLTQDHFKTKHSMLEDSKAIMLAFEILEPKAPKLAEEPLRMP